MNTRIMQTGNNKPEELTVGQKVVLIKDVDKFGTIHPKGKIGTISHLCPSTAKLIWEDGTVSYILSELFVPYVEAPKGKAGRPKGSKTKFKVGTLVVIDPLGYKGDDYSEYGEEGALGIVISGERNPMVYVLTGKSLHDRRWWFRRECLKKANPEDAGDQLRSAISDYYPRWDDVKELLTQIREDAGE